LDTGDGVLQLQWERSYFFLAQPATQPRRRSCAIGSRKKSREAYPGSSRS